MTPAQLQSFLALKDACDEYSQYIEDIGELVMLGDRPYNHDEHLGYVNKVYRKAMELVYGPGVYVYSARQEQWRQEIVNILDAETNL